MTAQPNVKQHLLRTAIVHGDRLRQESFGFSDLEWKKTDDPVTHQDRRTEKAIVADLKAVLPDATFVGEEHEYPVRGPQSIWMDPIDGTKSYVRGEFLSTLSVAITDESGKRLQYGAVYDFMRGVLYEAGDSGANMHLLQNGEVTKTLALPRERLLKKPTFALDHEDNISKALVGSEEVAIRMRAGSIALSLAQLAAGAYEMLIMRPYKKSGTGDIAAGLLIAQQAGINVTDRFGEPLDYTRPVQGFIAYHPKHREELKMILEEKGVLDSGLEKALRE